LGELDLRNNNLTEIPPEIGQLKNLEKLILWDNNLTALPPEVEQLNIKFLYGEPR
jgi:Leucine-rich repeat (LRR) protein